MTHESERRASRPRRVLPPDVLLTTEEFRALPQPLAGGLELHDGRVVEVAPVNLRHGRLQNRIGRRLGAWCEAHGLPEPVQELAGELVPGRTVAPDVAYLHPGPRQERAEAAAALEGPPDLAVEVVSPSETRPRVLEKVQWYLEAGCPLVWVVDPQRRTAAVYRPGQAARQLMAAGELDGEDVLPGFRLPLADLWDALGPR